MVAAAAAAIRIGVVGGRAGAAGEAAEVAVSEEARAVLSFKDYNFPLASVTVTFSLQYF